MIDQMAESLKTFAELQVYSNSQHQVITKQNAKINELEAQIKHLEKLLTDNSIIVGTPSDLKDMFIKCEDPEAIAHMQLKILRDKSLQGELTMEESKRVEIYTKILDSVASKKKDNMKDVAASTDTEELLKLVDGNSKP
jgi:hypothetical protein